MNKKLGLSYFIHLAQAEIREFASSKHVTLTDSSQNHFSTKILTNVLETMFKISFSVQNSLFEAQNLFLEVCFQFSLKKLKFSPFVLFTTQSSVKAQLSLREFSAELCERRTLGQVGNKKWFVITLKGIKILILSLSKLKCLKKVCFQSKNLF